MVRRSIALVCASIFTLGACGGGGGKGSADELGRAVVDALAKKDRAAMEGLVPTVDAIMSTCPAFESERGEIEKKRAKSIERLVDARTACEALDWSKATITAVEGGELKKPEDGCADLVEAKDIEVLAEIDGKKVSVKVDDPITLKGKFFAFDGIECGGGEHPGLAALRDAADKTCACKDMACAGAVQDQVMKDMQKHADQEPSAEQMTAISAELKRMTDCMTKVGTP